MSEAPAMCRCLQHYGWCRRPAVEGGYCDLCRNVAHGDHPADETEVSASR